MIGELLQMAFSAEKSERHQARLENDIQWHWLFKPEVVCC